MTMIASWDGVRLELWDDQGERQGVFESASFSSQNSVAENSAPDDLQDAASQDTDSASELVEASPKTAASQVSMADVAEGGSLLALSSVQAPVAALLLPAERLLQRSFSLPFDHPRFIDAAMLGQELADQAGAEADDWWLCWQAERAESGVRGLVFALPEVIKEELTTAPIGSQCPYIGPDIAVRLAVHLNAETTSTAVLDVDAEGLMLGLYAAGVWRGMRRLNLSAGRDRTMLAHEAYASLLAMGFDAAAMPLCGRLDAAWKQAFDAIAKPTILDWQVDFPIQPQSEALPDPQPDQLSEPMQAAMPELPTRHAANASAMAALIGVAPFNFRHGAWSLQTDWSKRIGPWRRTAALAAVLCLLVIGQDAYQLQQLQTRQEAARLGIENAFHQALPGVAMLDPMLQLRQAAGGGAAGNAWGFVRNLDAITTLTRKEAAFRPQNISYAAGEVSLSGMVPDFAAANRIRDALSLILDRKVELLDTDLSDKQVRIRLRWTS